MGQTLNQRTEQRIIERLRRLPRRQLDEVVQFIESMIEGRRSSATAGTSNDLRRSILALRGRGKGEHLVERLLQSREEDLRRDERR